MSQDDGKKPAFRSLKAFGVAGVLSEECEILYQSVFDTRQMGRIADLLSAKYEPEQVDDLRLRVLVLFSLYAGWEQQRNLSEEAPILLEVGVDADWIAVGAAFSPEIGKELGLGRLVSRLASREFQTRFDEVVAELAAHTTHLVIRYLPDETRMEVVGVFRRATFADQQKVFESANEMLVVEVDPNAATPPVKKTTQLGDLDYTRLLALRNQHSGDTSDKSLGETLVQGAGADASSRKVAGAAAGPESETRVSGAGQGVEVARVKGNADLQDTTRVLIKGDQSEPAQQELKGAPAGESEKASSYSVVHGLGDSERESYIKKIEDLQRLLQEKNSSDAGIVAPIRRTLREIFGGGTAGSTSVSAGGVSPAPPLALPAPEGSPAASTAVTVIPGEVPPRENLFRRTLKRLWSFASEDVDEPPSAPAAAAQVTEAPAAQAGQPATPKSEVDPTSNPESFAEKLLTEIQQGTIEKTIQKARAEADEMKREEDNPRMKRWADSLVGELLTEKGRLFDMAKKLNVAIRQKEHEFRGREQALQAELRKRDEELRQRTAQLEQAKKQAAVFSSSAAGGKLGAAVEAAEEAQLRQRLTQSSRSLQVVRDQNRELSEKVIELQTKLGGLQVTQRAKAAQVEVPQVQQKLDKALRQVEEFKKANQQLLERIGEAGRQPDGPSNEELSRKLETAMRVANVKKKEVEKLSTKVEDMQREEMRLKMEVARLQGELKRSKAAGERKAG